MDTQLEIFLSHRRRLEALAYRMLGMRGAAEDVVQDAWLRWQAEDRADVDNPGGFLTRTVTRLCLDVLKSAHSRRETYIGPWLPEPLLDDDSMLHPGPDITAELASEVSFAFLLALERLTPLERAVFLLHDVFDLSYPEIARSLERTEAACRQLASRARVQIRERQPRFRAPAARERQLVASFLDALQRGNPDDLLRLLAEDAVFVSDGGGRAIAATRPLVGRTRIVKLLLGLRRRYGRAGPREFRPVRVNGLDGFLVIEAAGRVTQASAIETDEHGRIGALYAIRNPDKLSALEATIRARPASSR